MSTITDVKCVLSQKAFDVFCEKFHISLEVHPVLTNRGDTMHERPAGKIRLYTRVFDFANFRLPLSTFLIDILRYFRINISQLSVIRAAKVSRFEILCRVYGVTPPVDYSVAFMLTLKRMDGCLSSSVMINLLYDIRNLLTLSKIGMITFSGLMTLLALRVFRGILPRTSSQRNSYAWLDLVAITLWMRKLILYFWIKTERESVFLVYTLCFFAFIHTLDPTKEKVVEREQKGDEPRLLETTISRNVPLLLVAPDHDESELDACVDKFFDEGGSVPRRNKEIPLPRRLKKRKTIVADAGGPSHPPKKLRKDHETPGGTFIRGKSRSAVQRLFAEAVQNAEGEGHTDSVIGRNLRTISALQRFVISSDSSHRSGSNIAEAEVDYFSRPSVPVSTAATTITSTADPAVVIKEKIVEPSLFAVESTSAGGTDLAMADLTDLTGSDFLWNVTNGSRLDDGDVFREMVDEFAPPKFFAYVREMEHDQLFIEFNVGAARQMSLSAEVRMRAEYNIREKRRLQSVVEEKNQLLKARDEEIENLKAQLLLKEAKVAEAIRLRIEASKLETAEKSLRDEVTTLNERNIILEKERNALDVKVTDLEAVVVSKEHELTDSTAQLTSIKSQNDNLADQVFGDPNLIDLSSLLKLSHIG
uniref:Transposase (Putative), gypsy type n=1 Tax=Tanacetum cinerariifolium TaxID=118510 RepID=A0A6L2JAI7_TANCI|nr:hypothetical protein [Tanacetum cinerariifolium]